MKALLLLFLALSASICISGDNSISKSTRDEIASMNSAVIGKEAKEATVLICTGKYSKKYHNSMCKGMKACKGETKKVSLSRAKEMGLTACGYCF